MVPAPADRAVLPDPDSEPKTVREFEDVVKSLPAGSDEQRAYYERWADKWR